MIFSYFPFWLVEQILVLIVQVPGHCLYFTFRNWFWQKHFAVACVLFLCSVVVVFFLLFFLFALFCFWFVCMFFLHEESYLTRLEHLYRYNNLLPD